ncbi:Uma2 family endonuclease [Romeria aff. gracilis LEGE 07310]|uniref:Uma2 family endonuclease n=1 Tax=Vasconcelosia minhoensis LEGE 07310 TaxID=915328 RepID=A0A8J7AJD7_9CYAN|nr:Uma2 family endonuclease [Romeria aff. gracilis LEGE 07310]
MIAISEHPMPAQDYLAWEAQQPIKYEYLNGEAYAMTGGTLAHNDIAVNLTTVLRTYLRGTGCKVRMADAKVGITEVGPFFYPDILVTCNERDRKALKIVNHPCLVVEVLSPGTEAFDRGEKFRQYRRLDSLREYALINAETMGVECYRLNERNKWELTSYLPEGKASADLLEIQLTSIGFECPLSLIYEDVQLSPMAE